MRTVSHNAFQSTNHSVPHAAQPSSDMTTTRSTDSKTSLGQALAGDASRLTPFERYMQCDDRGPGCAMAIPTRMYFTGKIDEATFTEAFLGAIAWHPMMGCLIERQRWVPSEQAVTAPRYFRNGQTPTDADRYVSVTQGPAIRCNVEVEDDGGVIELVVHHANIDGVSLIEFCGDLFAWYATIQGVNLPKTMRPPRYEYLAKRHLLDRSLPEPISFRTVVTATVRESVKFLARRAEVVASDMDAATPVASRAWTIADTILDVDATNQIHHAASARGITINDWAITALLRVIADWNTQHHAGSNRSQLVLNMPVLMRPRQAIRISASNMLGYAFIARRREDLQAWDAASESIAGEIQFIRRWKMAGMFIDGLARASCIPGGMFLGTRLLRPATCVMSHIGDLTRRFRNKIILSEDGFPTAGDLVIRQLSGAAPVRPGTHLTSALTIVGGQLQLSIRVKPDCLSQQAATTLADRWREEIARHA